MKKSTLPMVRAFRVTVSPGTPLAEDHDHRLVADLEDTTGDGAALLGTLYINKIPHHLEFLTLEEYNNRGYLTNLDVPPERFRTIRVGEKEFIAVLTPFERHNDPGRK